MNRIQSKVPRKYVYKIVRSDVAQLPLSRNVDTWVDTWSPPSTPTVLLMCQNDVLWLDVTAPCGVRFTPSAELFLCAYDTLVSRSGGSIPGRLAAGWTFFSLRSFIRKCCVSTSSVVLMGAPSWRALCQREKNTREKRGGGGGGVWSLEIFCV